MAVNQQGALSPTLYTIGHSTRPIDDLIAILKSHGITRLADVRTIPKSRHNPQLKNPACTGGDSSTRVEKGIFHIRSLAPPGWHLTSNDSSHVRSRQKTGTAPTARVQ